MSVAKLPMSEIEQISEEVEKGLEDSNVIKKFLEKRVQIEEEYAKNLQKLCKSQPNLNKLGGISGAFAVIVDNTNQYSNHIIQVVQKINDDINEPLKLFLKDLKAEQKTYFLDGQHLVKERKSVIDSLKLHKANYDSVSKDPESDPAKMAQVEEEYKYMVSYANKYHAGFHDEKFPKIQNDFQRLETIRMQRMKTNLKKFINDMDSIPGRLTTTLKASEETINAIDTKRDIMAFANFNKALNVMHPEFVFEPCEKKKKGWRSTMSVLKIGGGSSSSSSSSSSNSTTSVSVSNQPSGTSFMSPYSQNRDISSSHPLALFSVPVGEVMDKQKSKYPDLSVPYVLVLLITIIKCKDGMVAEGVFRIPGHNNEIIAIKKRLNEGDYNIDPETNVHIITSLLKSWLREMPQPLIPDELYESAVGCESTAALMNIFLQLPPHNQRIVTYISCFLKELTLPENVAHSKMTQDNMAMVFAPSFLRCSNPEMLLANIEKEKLFIRTLIESSNKLLELCPLNLGNYEEHIREQYTSLTLSSSSSSSLTHSISDSSVPPTITVDIPSSSASSSSSSSSSSSLIKMRSNPSLPSQPPPPLPNKKPTSSSSLIFQPNSLGHHLHYPLPPAPNQPTYHTTHNPLPTPPPTLYTPHIESSTISPATGLPLPPPPNHQHPVLTHTNSSSNIQSLQSQLLMSSPKAFGPPRMSKSFLNPSSRPAISSDLFSNPNQIPDGASIQHIPPQPLPPIPPNAHHHTNKSQYLNHSNSISHIPPPLLSVPSSSLNHNRLLQHHHSYDRLPQYPKQ